MPNPGFDLATDTTSTGATAISTSTSTGDPGTVTLTTSNTSQTTSGTIGDTGTSEPVTTTIEPGTQTSDPVGTSGAASSTGEPPTCELPAVNESFAPYVFVEGAKVGVCPQPLIAKGMLSIGSKLEVLTDPNCGDINPPTKLRLGDGYPMLPALVFPACVTTIVTWKPADNTCKIGRLWIAPNVDINTPIVFANYSVPPDPAFPIQPLLTQQSFCGCPDGKDAEGCCSELQPGEMTLQPNNNVAPLPQFSNEPVPVDGSIYEFYNLQSWVGPECVDDPLAGRRIDWLAVLTQ